MADLPEFKRTTEVSGAGSIPDFGEAMRGVASASWGTFGALGASVAQSASQQMAKDTGYQLGLNPKGDLLPPITDFDKTVTDTYHSQAYTTLSLQANQMFYNADNTLKQAPYLTPDLIDSTSQQLTKSVYGIINNAPEAIKPQLQSQLIGQIESQTSNYQNKMYEQNLEIDRSTANQFVKERLVNIQNLSMSGNILGAQESANVTIDMIKMHREMGLIKTDEEEQAQIKSVEDSRDTAMARYRYGIERSRGKGGEYISSIAKNSDIPDDKKAILLNSVLQYDNLLNQANNESENIKVAQMSNRIALNPNSVSGTDMAIFKDQVNPLRYQQVEHELIQAKKAELTQNAGMTELMVNWQSSEAHANTEPKVQTATYHALVNQAMQPTSNGGLGLNQEDSEVTVARSAGAPVENFTKSLNYKATSGNPAQIEEAARQYHSLLSTESGHALIGVTDQAKAMIDQYQSLRNFNDPQKAAQQAIDTVQNQDPEVMRQVDEKWSLTMKNRIGSGVLKYKTPSDFALSEVGLGKKDFGNPSLKLLYGTDILGLLKSNFRLVKGDYQSAQRLTQQQVDLNYGYSRVNGSKIMMEHPLEKVLGYKSSDVVPYIHEDMKRTLDTKFELTRKSFNAGRSNTFWTTSEVSHETKGFGNYSPLQVTKHTRGGKSETYDVIVQGNEVGTWDIALNTALGMRNIFLEDNNLGYITYVPNKKMIDASYQKMNQISSTAPSVFEAKKYFPV